MGKKFLFQEKCRKFVTNVRFMKASKNTSKAYSSSEVQAASFEEPVSPYYQRGGVAQAIALLGLSQPDSLLDAPNDFDVVDMIRKGLTKKSLDHLMDHFDVTATEMAKMLHTSDRTMRRFTEHSVLNPEHSERLIELAKVFAHGLEVFGSAPRLRKWFTTEVRSLGGRRPLDLLDTSLGISIVNDTLGRIEHGIVA